MGRAPDSSMGEECKGLVSPSAQPPADLLAPCQSPPWLRKHQGLGQLPVSPAPLFQVPSSLSSWQRPDFLKIPVNGGKTW